MRNHAFFSSVRLFAALLLALLASSCATGVELRAMDPSRESVVFGRMEGWNMGQDVLGWYASNNSSPGLACGNFYLFERKTKARIPLSLTPSGYYQTRVPAGEYFLFRSGKDSLGKERGRSRFGGVMVEPGKTFNLGTLRIRGEFAKEQFLGTDRPFSGGTMWGTFLFHFAYQETESSWGGPLATFREKQGDEEGDRPWEARDINLLRGFDRPHPEQAGAGPAAWTVLADDGYAPLAGALIPHDDYLAVLKACWSGSFDKVKETLAKRSLTVNSELPTGDMERVTPFLLACQAGNPEVVKGFLQMGADTNARFDIYYEEATHRNATCLYMALIGLYSEEKKPVDRYFETVRLLLEAGADPTAGIYQESDQESEKSGYFSPVQLAGEFAEKDPSFKSILKEMLLRSPNVS